MKGYTKTFVDYCLAQAYYLDSKESLGNIFSIAANNGLQAFKSEISPRAKSGPQYIQLLESTSGEDNFSFF
jgi:hypothetical protein